MPSSTWRRTISPGMSPDRRWWWRAAWKAGSFGAGTRWTPRLSDTMALPVFVRGLAVGFSIAAPVGPIGVLCIRRTLADGRAAGFVSGLGAATADATYGCIAGFGLTAIANLLVGQQFWISLIGGIFLCYLGVKTFISQPAEKAASARSAGLGGAYGSTLFLRS